MRLNKVCVYEKRVKFTASRSFVLDRKNKALTHLSDQEEQNNGFSFQKNIPSTGFQQTNNVTPSQNAPTGYPYPITSQNSTSNTSYENPGEFLTKISHQPPRDPFQIPQPSHYILAEPAMSVADRQRVNNSLFNGANNVISDLNDMIRRFNFDYGVSQAMVAQGIPQATPPAIPEGMNNSNVPNLINNQPIVYRYNKHLPDENSSAGNEEINSSHSGSVSASNANRIKAFPPPPLSILTSNSPERFDYLFVLNQTVTRKDLSTLCNSLGWPSNSPHTEYLETFVTKIHPNFLPFTTCFMGNAYINCFLSESQNAPYLLFAMLAIAAKYEAQQVAASSLSSGGMSEQARKKFETHKNFRSSYLSSCMNSLNSIMDSKPEILKNIEPLLMTILVLASDFSGIEGCEWRSHLNGAKDLLVKYCKFRPVSLELVIVWLWFYSMETLAGLSAYNGGTIHDLSELPDFLEIIKSTGPSIGWALKQFGFLFGGYYDEDYGNPILKENPHKIHGDGNDTDELNKSVKDQSENDEKDNYLIIEGRKIHKVMNYNLYTGYNDDVIDIFNDIFVAIECQRKYDRGHRFKSIFTVLSRAGNMKNEYLASIFTKIAKARSFVVINNNAPYRIPLDSPYHPMNPKGYHYNNPTGVNLVLSGYIHDTNIHTRSKNEADNWYSWMDLSQQMYVDACLLRLLTMKRCLTQNGLPLSSSVIQDVTDAMHQKLECLVKVKAALPTNFLNELLEYYGPDFRIKTSGIISSASNRTQLGKKTPNFQRYLDYDFDSRLVMIQWPLFMCGLCSITPRQKIVIDCCLHALIHMGVGSAEIMLRRLNRLWKLQKEGRFDQQILLFGKDDDSVPFT